MPVLTLAGVDGSKRPKLDIDKKSEPVINNHQDLQCKHSVSVSVNEMNSSIMQLQLNISLDFISLQCT